MTLKTEIDRFAQKIIKECLETPEKPLPFQERLDAFKAVASYYAILAKTKGDAPPADEGETFAAFRETLQRTEQEPANGGSAKIHPRRGPTGSVGGPEPRPIGGS